jgi:SAM-dependent methyltransferase
MQKRFYERNAAADIVSPGFIEGDHVVGSWAEHDEWADYEDYLMRYVPADASWVALDFGCGPGRNLRRWSSRFRRIDGVDISAKNLENAKTFIRDKVPPEKQPNLFLTGGQNCGDAPKNTYDFVFSTICLQHICVHSVRYSILRSLFDCLKPGGRLSVQMGYGIPSPHSRGYYEDFVAAPGTNRDSDVAIASPDEPKGDLEKIGFVNFEHWIRPVGPGDLHPAWIFFTAVKLGVSAPG